MIFAYGPWVSDAGHCFKLEIHPAEQLWWRKKINDKSKDYYLIHTCDQADRFDDKSEFDIDEILGRDIYLKNVWAPHPLEGTFAINFAIQSGMEKAIADLTAIGNKNVSKGFNDGSTGRQLLVGYIII